jgi:16S rRNA (cytosine1402-N4)-methyltransferase
MLAETLEYLRITELPADPAPVIIDGTLGLGGHTEAILMAHQTVRVIGFDRDADSLALASERLARFGDRFRAVHGNFREIPAKLPHELPAPAGVLLDLGISSWQLAERGFSFAEDAPLDFRMDASTGETAADLVNGLPVGELADVLYQYGDEHRSRRIAKTIVANRPITTTTQLADVIQGAVGRRGRLHPATKSFQALRIAVNDELGSLEAGLQAATDTLALQGRLVVLSFHSLEDRIAKRFIKGSEHLSAINKKVVRPTADEVAQNPRARSTKLRAAEKT